MGEFFRNRTAKEWASFLEANGFKWIDGDGDDQVWKHPNHPTLAILVPTRNETIILPTSMDMARKVCICLGIKKKEILEWWNKN